MFCRGYSPSKTASSDDVDATLSRFEELQTTELVAPLSENDRFVDEDAAP
jgi:hypothetical protein